MTQDSHTTATALADNVETLHLKLTEEGPIYFVSDLHIGDGSHGDVFGEKDSYFLDFLDEVEAKAQTLVILGDALDFEQAWYFSRIVRGHPELLSRLTKLAERMPVLYVYGNHDPDIMLFRDLLKWKLCSRIIVDDSILAVHGYEFDPWIGQKFEESSIWARGVMLYERLFRTRIRLPLREYYNFSNRAAHYLFFWHCRFGRLLGRIGARMDRPELGSGIRAWCDFWTRGVLGDPMGITMPVVEQLRSDDRYRTIICGHSHLPGVVQVGEGKTYVNLGSWSFGNSQFGVWNGETFVVRDWISGWRIRDENYRPIFEGQADRNYDSWFKDQYMGFLRFRSGEELLREGVRARPWALTNLDDPGTDTHSEIRIATEGPQS